MYKYEQYLKEIGIKSRELLSRLTTLYNICAEACPEDINQIFVSEYLNSDNSRVYESLFLFSNNFIIEIKQPFNEGFRWDISGIFNSFKWVDFSSSNFDYETATSSSKLQMTCTYHTDLQSEMKATESNCIHLWTVYKETIRPNLLINSR